MEAVLKTAEFAARPPRISDFESENKALIELAMTMAETPKDILQKLADTALRLCRAESSGISIEEEANGKHIFRWYATAGKMISYVGGTMPREFSPCGVTVDKNAPQLMQTLVRHYPYVSQLSMPFAEVLLVPFHQHGKPIGTIWVVSHEKEGTFDGEDSRILNSLCKFASAATENLKRIAELESTSMQLYAAASQVESALEVGDIGIWAWDVKNDRVFADKNTAAFFSVSSNDANGGKIAAYLKAIHPEDLARVSAEIESASKTQNAFVSEYRVVGLNGTARWLLARCKILRDANGTPIQFPGVLIDITKRREADDQIRIARDEAIAASFAKDDFLAALSHELRTPLSPVLTVASEHAINDSNSPEIKEAFELIRKNVELETRLIDDLLDLTKIIKGKMSFRPTVIKPVQILHEAIENIRTDLTLKEIHLELELACDDVTIWMDAVRLQQVFWNVLKNAIKFTPEKGRITISSKRTSEGIGFEFTDTGIGMTADEIERVFGAFSQGDHAANTHKHRFGGLGLGLAISKSILHAQGGKISAGSKGMGQGSTFFVELPPHKIANRPATEDKQAEKFLKSLVPALRILLVEDHEPTRSTLQQLLQKRGHSVTAVGNAANAISAGELDAYDLLLCDIGLPDQNGYEVVRALKKVRSEITSIALTGYGMDDDVERARAAGFSDHLTKPVSVSLIDASLQRLFQKLPA